MSGPLYALVLAAGAGRRFGGDKLLAPYRGFPLLDQAVNAALAAPVAQVVLVTGHDAERVGAAGILAARRAGAAERLRLVHAPDHGEGMGASLRAGIGVIPQDAQGVFVFLGDMPLIPCALASRLAAALGDAPAAVPVHGGRRGHPVLFAAKVFPHLTRSWGDAGAKALIHRLGSQIVQVETDEAGVLVDIDSPEDLAAL